MDRNSVSQKVFVTNRFGLNPQPTAVWFVEGESELEVLQLVDKEDSGRLDQIGVVLRSIRGTGGIKNLPLAIETAQAGGSLVFLLVDEADQGASKAAERLVRDGRIKQDDVYYSRPRFEEFNFSEAERGRLAAGDRLSGKGKQRKAAVAARAFIVPELRLGNRQRPIVKQCDDVVERAWRHGRTRPRYHPNLAPKPQQS